MTDKKEEYVDVEIDVSEEVYNKLHELAMVNKMSVDEFTSELLKKRLEKENELD